MASAVLNSTHAKRPNDSVPALMDFWQAGHRSLKRFPFAIVDDKHAYSGLSKGQLEAEASIEQLNPDSMTKARRVAQQYSQEDIRVLCRLTRDHKSHFGPTHLIRLLAVDDRRARDKLAHQAIKSRWSVRQLERLIQAVKGPRGYGGRRPSLAKTERQLLIQLVSLCVKWERWTQAVALSNRLPKSLVPKVKAAAALVLDVKTGTIKQLALLTAQKAR